MRQATTPLPIAHNHSMYFSYIKCVEYIPEIIKLATCICFWRIIYNFETCDETNQNILERHAPIVLKDSHIETIFLLHQNIVMLRTLLL